MFFSDIKAFTELSEQLTADVIVRLLNAYFTAVTRIIRERNGIVDKYIGDAVMAFWTPPFAPGESHAEEACLAALAQQAALTDFRRELSNVTGLRRDVPDFRVRMGLATGEVVVGTIGSDTTKSYTVIGDIVNGASRLEVVNKVYGTSILVSGDTMRLAQNAVEARELDLLLVAGNRADSGLRADGGRRRARTRDGRAARRLRRRPVGVSRAPVGHRRAEVCRRLAHQAWRRSVDPLSCSAWRSCARRLLRTTGTASGSRRNSPDVPAASEERARTALLNDSVFSAP